VECTCFILISFLVNRFTLGPEFPFIISRHARPIAGNGDGPLKHRRSRGPPGRRQEPDLRLLASSWVRMKVSRSPSRTFWVWLVSAEVRWSFTIWYGART